MADFEGFSPEEADLLKKKIEDSLPQLPEDETVPALPSKANRHEEACFPSNDYGMPLALLEIPARERSFFWRDGRYRGCEIAYVGVQDPRHRYLFEQKPRDEKRKGQAWHRAFYVRSKKGTVGLVPFPNSTIVWPGDLGWTQDLAPENQGKPRSDFKSQPKARKE